MENWTLTWTKLTSLDSGSVSNIPANLPGVYRLSYKAEDGSFYVFYIGKAEGIKERLLQHLSENEENVCIKNYLTTKKCFFRYATISKDYIRNAAEKLMYRHYQPVCNLKAPEGRDDIKLNLT